jgi:PBSX family phage terminase large subunit
MPFSKKQVEFFNNADKRWNFKSGATRSGKSYMDYYVIPKRIRARIGEPGLVVILGVSKGTIERNILEPMRDIWGSKLVGEINSQNKAYLFGEMVYCLGAEKVSQVSKLRGASIKYCYGDEVADWNKEVFQLLKSRLDKPYSCFDGALNPQNPTHWLKAFLDSDADIYCQHYTIFDNPFLDPKFVEELCKEYDGTVYYDRYIKGLWKRAEGAIYRKFADNTKAFYCKVVDFLQDDIGVKQILKSTIQEIVVGVDFGGNKSGHAFVATAKTNGYKDLIALKSERHFGELLSEDLNKLVTDFCKQVISQYGPIDYVYWDNAETVLGRGIKAALEKEIPSITVRPALKDTVNDRIRCTTMLMGLGRFWYCDGCNSLKDALTDSVWNQKNETKDERLDDGSTDIDSLDAFEYTFERAMRKLIDMI